MRAATILAISSLEIFCDGLIVERGELEVVGDVGKTGKVLAVSRTRRGDRDSPSELCGDVRGDRRRR